jgi:hypothetical protein
MRHRGLTQQPTLDRRTALAALLGSLVIALISVLLSASSAHAATCSAQDNYEGVVNGSWSTGTWSKGKPPTSTETGCIPEGKGTIEVATGFKAEAKTLTAQSAVKIASTGTLTIAETLGAPGEGGITSTFSGLDVEVGGHLSTAGGWLFLSGDVTDDGEISTPSPASFLKAFVKLVSGTFSGGGGVNVQFGNFGGTVEPGGAGVIGELHFTNYSEERGHGATLSLDLKSNTEYDRLGPTTTGPNAGGSYDIRSAITVNLLGSYTPVVGTEWEFITDVSADTIEEPTLPTDYKTEQEPFGALLILKSPLSSPPSEKPTEEKHTEEKAPEKTPSPTGGSTTTTTGGSTSGGTTGGALTGVTPVTLGAVASTPAAIEEVRLGCSKAQLVLNDAYIHGGRVVLEGSAAKSLAGKQVEILFNERKQVATAKVGASGEFNTTAPLPPAKIREALTTRYSAEIGKVRSLHLKLTRRLLLEPPKASGTTVTLSGVVTPPLTKPIAPVVVEQQLECGVTTIVKTFTPPASGRFEITVTVPANAKAGIYRLKSTVAANAHATEHGFTTFSLPLPVALG